MTDFRSITRDDVPEVAAYALAALREVAPDGRVRISPLKVRDAVAFFAKDTSGLHFNLAAFELHGCVGAIAAVTAEMTYFERQEAHVMFARATLPGVGMKLIRELVGWVRAEPRLRRVVWAMNPSAMGSRMERVITRRLGFESVATLVWSKE